MNIEQEYVRTEIIEGAPIKFDGVATGHMFVKALGRNYVLIHESGHKYWKSRGSQGYFPARYHLMKIEGKDKFDRTVLMPIEAYRVGKRWRLSLEAASVDFKLYEGRKK